MQNATRSFTGLHYPFSPSFHNHAFFTNAYLANGGPAHFWCCMKTRNINRFALFLFAAALAACSSDNDDVTPPNDIEDPVDDAGTGDGDGDADSGTDDDADAGDDAGPDDENDTNIVIKPREVNGPRRGPILLGFEIEDPDSELVSLSLEHEKDGAWVAATATLLEDAEGKRLYLWDSFVDVEADGDVKLRLVAEAKEGSAAKSFTLDVRNAPDTDRVVLVGQPMVALEGGGAQSIGTALTAFVWSGASPELVGDPKRLNVGKGPKNLVAAPHGRATVVVNEADGTFSVVTTPLDAKLADVQQAYAVELPHGNVNTLRFTPDGRFLYVVGSKEDTNPHTIWRYEPSEDLSSFGTPTVVKALHGNSSRLAVEGTTGRLLVTVGFGDNNEDPGVFLLGPDGSDIASLTGFDFLVPDMLAISPAGGTALFGSHIFGDEVRRLTLGADTLEQHGDTIETVPEPTDVVFHPASTTDRTIALVSNLSKNRVTPIVITPDETTVGTSVAGMGLAAEMDIIERGSQTGTVLVTGVVQTSRIHRAILSEDGTVTAEEPALELGAGAENIPVGISVQR